MQQQLLEKLKQLGFKEYEAKAFMVLLKGRLMSASEIAKEAKIIRNSIYDILKSFVDKGFCNEIETNTILQYRIIDPHIIFDKIEKDYRDEHQKNIALIKQTLKEAEPIFKAKPSDDPDNINIELVRGFNKHRVAKYIDLLSETKSELLGMYRLKGLVSGEIDTIVKRLIKSGGAVKTIYHSSLDFKVMKDNVPVNARVEDFIKILEKFSKAGEEVRVAEDNIPNMTIFDKRKVFFNLGDKRIPQGNRADLIVRYDDFASYMEDLFTFYWNKSLSLEEYKSKHIYKISNN
jgi:sugar-specific transcriptional regulator TrmB